MDDLILLLASDDKHVRRTAVEQLRAMLPASRDAMVRALAAHDWKVRASAAAVLDHAEHDDEVERALRAAARDVHARVRDSAFHSLSCAHCKPEGCVATESVELLVDGLLHDPSVRVRRKLAGELMWAQHGVEPVIVEAFHSILDHEPDRTLRDRAATFLASVDLPRDALPYREWLPAWQRRRAELLDSTPPPERREAL